ICLFAAPQIMWILKRPLKEAWLQQSTHQVSVKLLGNTIGSFDPATNSVFGSLGLKGKTNAVIELVPTQMGTNLVLGMNIVTDSADAGAGPNLIFLDPGAPFMLCLQLGFFGGLILACPFVFYFVGQFVMPALKIREKKYF